MQSDLKLGLLTGSRAKTDAWFFSAMLFPFCLAGSQEEQGLECEPFGGGLKDLPSFSRFAGAGPASAAFPGEVGFGHTWCISGRRPGSTWNSLLVRRVKATLLLAGIRLVTSHPSPFGTGEHGANAIGEGELSHKDTDSAHRAKGFVSQQVPVPTCECGRVGDILGARHSGSRSTAWQRARTRGCPALGHGMTTPAISLGVKNWSH